MADRKTMQEDLSVRLVATLLDRAARASDRGEAHVALEAYDRILALSPAHPEAIRRVRELSRGLRLRRNLRRGITGLTLGLVIVGLVAAAFMLPEPVDATGPSGRALQAVSVPPAAPTFQRPAPPQAKDAAAAQPTTAASGASKTETKKRPTTFGARATQRPKAARKPPRASAAARVLLTVSPPAVKLRVDGRQVAVGRPLTLTPGAHVAELTHPQCADCGVTRRRIQIPKNAAGRTIKRHLKFAFEPAKLTVTCGGGEVSVDGKVYGACGKTYKIPVHSPTPKTVRVKVRLQNGSVKQRSYSLKRGGVIRWTLP